MMQAIEQADGYSCDIWVKETVNLDSSGNYGNMASTKRVIFPLAKLQDPKQAGRYWRILSSLKDVVMSMNKFTSNGGSRISQTGWGGQFHRGCANLLLGKILATNLLFGMTFAENCMIMEINSTQR